MLPLIVLNVTECTYILFVSFGIGISEAVTMLSFVVVQSKFLISCAFLVLFVSSQNNR